MQGSSIISGSKTTQVILKQQRMSQSNDWHRSVTQFYKNWEFDPGSGRTLAACLIHASRTLKHSACRVRMSGERVSNTWEICLGVGDNIRKRMLIPHIFWNRMVLERKTASAVALRWSRGVLVSWWGKGLPRPWYVADLRGWSATLGLRHGPDSYGRQQ